MNAMSPPISLIPEDAPFSPAQRAWLNGFLAGLYGGASIAGLSIAPPPPPEPQDLPWHDPALELDERMRLAEGRPLQQRLMAAMGQLDCGQCGYLCQSYAAALSEGRETSTSRCVPGAKPTARLLKRLLTDSPVTAVEAPAAVTPAIGRAVRVLAATPLTRSGSSKDVRHVTIDLAESGLTYEPGDSIGLVTPNDPALVDATLVTLGASGDETVPCPDGSTRPIREAFTRYLDIARPLDRTTDLLAMSAKYPRHAATLRKLSEGADGAEPADADLLDLLQAFPSARPPLADLAASLPGLRPRLYSIASSPRAAPGQVHLCVAVVRDTRRGRVRNGIGSGFLADRAASAGLVDAYIQTSHFRLPADPAVPLIMVGPGTGIAPFRAFLAERAAARIRGRTWLLFGDRSRATDFLYENELTAWRKDGTLLRLDTAFSRDQRRKIYVQHRMAENAEDLWRWLQDGAHFYVCGDAFRMAKDVDTALRRLAMTEGRLSEHQARDWIIALARQGRYLRDVY
ncbi:MAG TPA: sulfite reductase subunit alpha [Acetobacteraceae bacterium]|jgi:sulfite reductase (NADPH) flavoprotein alpha-component